MIWFSQALSAHEQGLDSHLEWHMDTCPYATYTVLGSDRGRPNPRTERYRLCRSELSELHSSPPATSAPKWWGASSSTTSPTFFGPGPTS